MSSSRPAFDGSIPTYYDRCLGPFLFEPYAADLARRVGARPGSGVLELACGTGIATSRLRAALPASTSLVATDLSAAMIDIARAKLGAAEVHWRTADASSLPFKDRSFDTVACQFGLMFFPDKPLAMREVRRVLRPGGRLVASVWESLEANPAAAIAHAVASRMFEGDPPQFLHVPYGALDAETARALAAEAGFGSVSIDRVELEGRAETPRTVAEGFAKGSPLALELEARGADLDAVAEAFASALLPHGGTPFHSPLSAFVLTAS
jgi:SAM-dependent methyltransferase